MKKYTLYFLALAFLSFTLLSCKEEPKKDKLIHEHDFPKVAVNSNLNISILLDLSDRINPEKYPSPAMEFYQRDIGYLKAVAENFESHIDRKSVV